MLFPLNFDMSKIIGEKEIENVKPCDTWAIRMSGFRMVCKNYFFDYLSLSQSNPNSALKNVELEKLDSVHGITAWKHGKRSITIQLRIWDTYA